MKGIIYEIVPSYNPRVRESLNRFMLNIIIASGNKMHTITELYEIIVNVKHQ